MEKVKIKVLTFHAVSNHGSALQTLATQKKLEALGCEVEFIDFRRYDCVSSANLVKFWNRGRNFPLTWIRAAILWPQFKRWERMFGEFRKKYIHLGKPMYTSEEQLKNFPLDADVYCVGSDQVWNSDWNEGIIPPFFLSFIPDNCKKISYSSSFGLTELPEKEKPEIKKLLSSFDFLSVRESSGVDILHDLGFDGEHILDPTLNMTKEFWAEYTPPRMVKEPYLLIYQLYSSKEFDDYAIRVAKHKGLKVVRLCTLYHQLIRPGKGILAPHVEDFLSLVKYADLVMTDSFHATAFSVNLNRNFISIIPKFGGRIFSLLELVGLKRRATSNLDDITIADDEIDFESVNKVLDEMREKADAYLHKAIGI